VYTRYGDGEMNIMLGEGGGGQDPDPALAAETRELFDWLADDYENLLGLAMHRDERGMTRALFKGWDNPVYDQFRVGRRFESAIALHYYAVFKPHLLRRLFDLIRYRPKVLVTSLPGFDNVGHRLDLLIGPHQVVSVPAQNAYTNIDEWYGSLEEHSLILFAAGPAKCAASLRILKSGRQVQVLDLGSIVDLAAGVASRSWIMETPVEARKVLLGG